MESRKSLFVIIRRYGPPYDPQTPIEAQLGWESHRIFMNALEAEGLASLAGPLEGTTEVLLVFRADNEDEINERLLRLPERTLFTPHLGSAVGTVRKEIERAAAQYLLALEVPAIGEDRIETRRRTRIAVTVG